ncbi:MAG: hypothetical protein GTO63_11465, partial [Anaerolineae bacterium]|nr:hypothetical protein [Anaerolineae bacterium]
MTEPATFLDRAQAEVAEMWEECSNLSDVQMASANDTIHFLHEEAGEVVKCAMHLGLIGDKTYFRSNKVRETVYTWKDLIGEIGD